MLNPKLTIFFFVFLPQFVHPGESAAVQQMLTLSAVFMPLTLLVFSGYGIFAAAMRAQVLGRPLRQRAPLTAFRKAGGAEGAGLCCARGRDARQGHL